MDVSKLALGARFVKTDNGMKLTSVSLMSASKEGLDENGSDHWLHEDLDNECKYCGKRVDNLGKIICSKCIEDRKDILD